MTRSHSLPPNWNSRSVTRGLDRSVNRALLRATGMRDADFERSMIGIANGFSTTAPCNGAAERLVGAAAEGIREGGSTPQVFGFPMVSDGIAMGTAGMRYSLVSREVIADSIETVSRAHAFDGLIVVGACDKNGPGATIAAARLDVPYVFVFAGTIAPGHWRGREVTSLDVADGLGRVASGEMSAADLAELEAVACPGSGACGGMYTANTMSAALEAMGVAIPGSATLPAEGDVITGAARLAGVALNAAILRGITARTLITRDSLLNAVALVQAIGGSTNAVLHLLAIAHAANVDLALSDFELMRRRLRQLTDLRPGGRYVAADLAAVGGIPVVIRELIEAGVMNGDCPTIVGGSLADSVHGALPEVADGSVIHPWNDPVAPEGGLAVLFGSLAPEGCVAKLAGIGRRSFVGPARVFDSEEAALQSVLNGDVLPGDVIVIRFEGPRGGPGMREMLSVTSAIVGRGLTEDVCLITDGRFSGGSHGVIIGHVAPEAQLGGPIALLEDGDEIAVDLMSSTIDAHIPKEILSQRMSVWRAPAPYEDGGVLGRYARLVSSAATGAVLP